jgi:hypothetical protein
MSIYSLDTLTEDGGGRILVETAGVAIGFTLVFSLAVAPALQAIAPEVFGRAVIGYSRTDLPDAALEYVHLFGLAVSLGGFVYWRLWFTELGATFRAAVTNGRPPDR